MCLMSGSLLFYLMGILMQIKYAQGGANLYIRWTSFPGATNYILDLRVINSTTVTPIVLDLTATTTEKLVQGLRSGTLYQVTLKVYQFYYVMCISSEVALTVPAASQITFAKSISSTSVGFQWAKASGADGYVLVVAGITNSSDYRNLTVTSLSAVVTSLQPSTSYSCYIYSYNSVGMSAKGAVKTVTTLVPPPAVVNTTGLNLTAVRASWPSVANVLFYQVSLTDSSQPGLAPVIWTTSAMSLIISNLKACTSYTISVSSLNSFLVPGEPFNITYTTSPTGSVTTISADYSCSSNTATVYWDAVLGAVSYRAVVTSTNRTSLTCTSTGSSCQVTALGCSTHYSVEVTVVSNCEVNSSISYTFDT
ncbi:hypothetical protein P4O66_014811, partial [Electrophorus voltai]